MSAQSSRGVTIVVMLKDDSQNSRVTSVLRQRGFTVLHATTPDDAMTRQRDEASRIHLLIADDSLDPDFGTALFHRMGVSHSDLIVLYVSEQIPGHALIQGIDQVHFISHPFTDTELFAAVSRILSGGMRD